MQIFNIHRMFRYSAYCMKKSNFHPAPATKSRYIPKIKLSLLATSFFPSTIWSNFCLQFFLLCKWSHNDWTLMHYSSPQLPCCASWRCLQSQTSRAGPEQSAAIWTATCRYGFNESESEKKGKVLIHNMVWLVCTNHMLCWWWWSYQRCWWSAELWIW